MTDDARLSEIRTRAASYYEEAALPVEVEPVETMQIRFGGAVKARKDSAVIEGLLIPYGSPTNLDHDAEFFSAKTDFGLKMPAAVKLHYNHGLNAKIGKTPLAWAHLEKREDGVWFKADLSEELEEWLEEEREVARKYQAATLQAAREGLLGASSGAASHLVMRRAAGKGHELTRWPTAEASVTPRPANPMTLGVSVKSMSELPDPEELLAAHVPVRRSLAERTEQVLDDLDDLLMGYRQVNGAEVKIGRALSASRRARLEQANQIISELLGETAVREESAEEPDAPAGMDEGEKSTEPDVALLQAEHLRLRTRAALIHSGATL